MEPAPAVRIPPTQLEPETLHGLIEEFVTRDGTELQDADRMIAEVMDQLRAGRAEIWFDPRTRSCNILPA